MPTLDELEELYDEKSTNEHGAHITELINVSADYIWADNNSWGGEGGFNFKTGSVIPIDSKPSIGGYFYTDANGSTGALPVRTAN